MKLTMRRRRYGSIAAKPNAGNTSNPKTKTWRQAAPASHTIPATMAVMTAALPMSGWSSRMSDKAPAKSSGFKVSKNRDWTDRALRTR